MSKYITDKRYFMILLILILIVSLTFIGIILWPDLSQTILPQSTPLYTPTITPTPTELPTNFPNVIRDYFENQNGTNGVLAGSVVLVLIILLGVLISIRNNEK
ncbi:MAG: hypothetical protein IJI14_17955 [Anaerolineaceae bacterium]|nr:hypothetical protein [Anaerolineaceae bacterium]